MELTEEQKIVSKLNKSAKVSACAGSGKTSVLVEFAKNRPKQKGLLICFNKSVKEEAKNRFPDNVDCQTAHSLAFKKLDVPKNYELKKGNYQSNEIVEILDIQNKMEGESKYYKYILASHILNKVGLFCQSDKDDIDELDYLKLSEGRQSYEFIKNNINLIDGGSSNFWGKVKDKEIPVTHAFYLKLFQLSRPKLRYDFVLLDEAQDCNPCMIGLFKNLPKKTLKLAVGDTHQSLYIWNGAVGTLETLDLPEYHLSSSFRFPQHIADICDEVLGLKPKYLNEKYDQKIYGLGDDEGKKGNKLKAILARSNLNLLDKSIEIVNENPKTKIFFEGGFNNYVFTDGYSLYDIYNLFTKKKDKIKSPFIKEFDSYADLSKFVEETDDRSLRVLMNIVERYRIKLPQVTQQVKKNISEKRQDADYILSTVHKAKGLEYDEVEVLKDGLDEISLLAKTKKKKDKDNNEQEEKNEEGITEFEKFRLCEEINILYVSVSRAIRKVIFPDSYLIERKKRRNIFDKL